MFKNGGRVQKKERPGRNKTVLLTALLLAALALAGSYAVRLQEQKDKQAAMFQEQLALNRQQRQLEQQVTDLQGQIALLEGQLGTSLDENVQGQKTLEDILKKLVATEGDLAQVRQQLQDVQLECAAILRPTEDQQQYQQLFPELYVTPPAEQKAAAGKVVYLTFDDGPSEITDKLLDTLDQYGIKATFFVVPSGTAESNARLRKLVQAGHTVGVHTYSHVYNDIYDSVEAYLRDFEKAFSLVEQATGVRPEIFRFPGGSINSYNRGVYQAIIAEMLRRGFTYYDWNASGDDSAGQTTASGIAGRAVATTAFDRSILLLHDASGKNATAKALPQIIEKLQAKGYRFEPLTNEVLPVVFAYKR